MKALKKTIKARFFSLIFKTILMVIIHRSIRRLKDTFKCAIPYNDIKQQQRIIGRRVFADKKLTCLPFDRG